MEFDRKILYDKELRITLDDIIVPTNDNIKQVIELKVYNDVKYLMEVMRSVMGNKNIESQITTHPKIDLFMQK